MAIEVKRPEFKPPVSLHTCVDMYMCACICGL